MSTYELISLLMASISLTISLITLVIKLIRIIPFKEEKK